jgi:outer membrane receptor for ferrienterochelin and colicins
MKIILTGWLWLVLSAPLWAQHSLSFQIRSHETGQPVPGVNIGLVGTPRGTTTDSLGRAVLTEVPAGRATLQFSAIGYETLRRTVPVPGSEPLAVELHPSEETLDEVRVTSTRGTRTIADEPTRVEIIAGEEVEEKVNMNAANIATMLRETPGIQVQQTSATSANMTYRIQGLEGRYTQLLENGLPLYAGFSGGLGLLQIPPLNLRQVEIIKGSASTLYGGGAIAGLVNLVTKEPTDRREATLLANVLSSRGLDLNGFYAERFGRFGLTIYASRNTQEAYDPNSDGFSDVPQSRRVNLNPRLFWYPSDRTTLSLGINYVDETRRGGALAALRGEVPGGFVEANDSRRASSQFRLDHRFNDRLALFVKNTVSTFTRRITDPTFAGFAGRQVASFSEVGLARVGTRTEWIGGLNAWTDVFSEQSTFFAVQPRDYALTTGGAFVQNTTRLGTQLTLETGLRLDGYRLDDRLPRNTDTLRWHLLPRVSVLWKGGGGWTSRLGGGRGYKAPTLFTEATDQLNLRGVLPLSSALRSERSWGLNWDLNYGTELAEGLDFSFNHLFFYTRLNEPAVLRRMIAGPFESAFYFETAPGYLDTRGFETNAKLTYHDLKLYGFYTLTDTRRRYDGVRSAIPLTARHRAGAVLMWERHESFRVGYEAYYFGPQERETGPLTRSYWVMGFMAEKHLNDHLSVWVNAENFTDSRLSRWQPVVSGSPAVPEFVREIWAPTDGRIFNGGLKLRW